MLCKLRGHLRTGPQNTRSQKVAAFGEVTTPMHFGREQGGRRAIVACTALSNGGGLAQIIGVPARHQGRLGFRAAGTATACRAYWT